MEKFKEVQQSSIVAFDEGSCEAMIETSSTT